MKHLTKYKKFEATQFIAKPGLKGGMDVNIYHFVSEDVKDMFYDLTEDGFECRTFLNGTETPTTDYTGTQFSIELTKPKRGNIHYADGDTFKYRDVSEEIERLYEYMETEKWIGTWTPQVEGVCQYYAGTREDDWTGDEVSEYKFYSAGWDRFKHSMYERHSKIPLKMVKIKFTLGR